MRIVGLDLSLAATGYADETGTRLIRSSLAVGLEFHLVMPRIDDIRCQILRLTKDADVVAIEGYSMGPQRGSSGIAQLLGEVAGVVKLSLWKRGTPLVLLPPTIIKKFATGKGIANKGMVLEAASKRSGADFGGDHNRADAFWARAAACEHYGCPVVSVPAAHVAALAKVRWPALAPLVGRE